MVVMHSLNQTVRKVCGNIIFMRDKHVGLEKNYFYYSKPKLDLLEQFLHGNTHF